MNDAAHLAVQPKDIVPTLRRLAERQGEDYIWRTAQAAADEIIMLRERLKIRDEQITALNLELKEAYRGAVDWEAATR